MTTADVIALDWRGLVMDRIGRGHFPTYFALLKALGLAGGSEFALRLPSAIFDGISCGLVALIGRRLDGWQGAAAAALLYALMPNLIQYGQEARPYALMLLSTVIAMAAMLRLVDGTGVRRRQALIATAGTLGAALAIPAGIATVAAQHLALLTIPLNRLSGAARRALALHAAATWAVIVIGLLTLIPSARTQAAQPKGLMKWQINRPVAARLSEALGETYGFQVPHDADRYLPAWGTTWLAAGFIALIAVGLWANRAKPAHRMLAVTMIGTAMIYVLLGTFMVTAGRYMLGMMPAAILLAAAGTKTLLGSARLRGPAVALLAVFLAGLCLQAADALVSERKYDWRKIAAFLSANDIQDIELLSDSFRAGRDLQYYLPAGRRISFSPIDSGTQSIDIMWARAAGRPVVWALIGSTRPLPGDLTAGAKVCVWPFGAMKIVMIAKAGSVLPAAIRGCAGPNEDAADGAPVTRRSATSGRRVMRPASAFL